MNEINLENRINELEQELSNLKAIADASVKENIQTPEERYSEFITVANYINAHIAYLNPDSLFYEFVNDAYGKSLGIPKEKIVGSHLKDVIGEKSLESTLEYINVVKSGRSVSFENVFDLSYGRRWLQVNYSPVFDSDCRIIGISIVSYDITDRKKAEDLLKHTSLNYETFFNTINEFLFVLDEKGNIIHTNSTVIDRLGYTRDELYGKSVFMVHPKERHEEVGRIVGEMLKGITEFCPVPLITKSGIQIPVETRVSPGFWNGEPVIFGVTKDISRIKLSEEKFSKLFHINPSACGLSDLDNHKYIEVNEAFCTLLGFDKEEVIGDTAINLGILTIENMNTILLNADNRGNVTNAEASLKAKNGEIKHVLLSSENIYVQDKRYRYTVVNDITERKKSEQALKESEEKYRAIFDSALVGMVVAKGLFAVSVNSAIQAIFGYSEKELLEIPFQELFYPDDRQIIVDRINRRNSGEIINDGVQVRIVCKSGEVKHVEITSSVFYVKNERYLQSIFIDITERIKSENALKESEKKLLQVIADKDKFFSIIAHDLRSPFNAFLGYTQMMAEEMGSMSITELQKIAVLMNNSATNLYSLLDNLLNWTRMKQGLFSYEPQKIVLADICSDAIEVLRQNAEEKNIEIDVIINKNFNVFADINMVKTIIRNLVANAIKFTNVNGTIKINAYQTPESVIISVSDNGVGIQPDILGKLFRISDVQTKKGTANETGTGLGLLLCKELVEKHNSKIWVESVAGIGSDFRFTLPASME
jgi:PAS domain S-box-containing protein